MDGACERCGRCCSQGGPALHSQDLALIRSRALQPRHLITIRKGELAFQPLAKSPQPVHHEFLKIHGRNGSWCCMFYNDSTHACTIYAHRPMACGLLDCTAPEPLLAVAGKDLLTRFDCIADDDPLLPLVRRYEQECPCPDMAALAGKWSTGDKRASLLEALTERVQLDLDFRQEAGGRWKLSVADELFYFGRPLFQLLAPMGIRLRESPAGTVRLQ